MLAQNLEGRGIPHGHLYQAAAFELATLQGAYVPRLCSMQFRCILQKHTLKGSVILFGHACRTSTPTFYSKCYS